MQPRKGLEGWEFELRPGARAIREVLRLVERVEDKRHLSDLVFVAQACGAMKTVYQFSPFGPEPLAPVSGELEYDLVLLEATDQIENRPEWSIRLATAEDPQECQPVEARAYVNDPTALGLLGGTDPIVLAAMAQVMLLKSAWEDEDQVLQKASEWLYLSQDIIEEAMSRLAACSHAQTT